MPTTTFTLTGSGATGLFVTHEHRAMVATLPPQVRLGRQRLPHEPTREIEFGAGAVLGATPPPPTLDLYTKAAAPIAQMYGNDVKGDCVIASLMHLIGCWTANDPDSGGTAVGTTNEAYKYYESWCGPGDNGCYIADVLTRAKAGITVGGKLYPIDAFASVSWLNKLFVQVGILLFRGGKIGFSLPQAWFTSAVWDVTSSPIAGGHDVCLVGYDANGVFVSSWGRIYQITWAAFLSRQYIDEMFMCVGQSLWGADQVGPLGFTAASLRAKLSQLGAGTLPSIDPPAPPPPPPPPSPPVVTHQGPQTVNHVTVYESDDGFTSNTGKIIGVALLQPNSVQVAPITPGG